MSTNLMPQPMRDHRALRASEEQSGGRVGVRRIIPGPVVRQYGLGSQHLLKLTNEIKILGRSGAICHPAWQGGVEPTAILGQAGD